MSVIHTCTAQHSTATSHTVRPKHSSFKNLPTQKRPWLYQASWLVNSTVHKRYKRGCHKTMQAHACRCSLRTRNFPTQVKKYANPVATRKLPWSYLHSPRPAKSTVLRASLTSGMQQFTTQKSAWNTSQTLPAKKINSSGTMQATTLCQLSTWPTVPSFYVEVRFNDHYYTYYYTA